MEKYYSNDKRVAIYNGNCLNAAKEIKDDSIDLILTDPPYGIDGDKLHKHYNRKEEFAIEGYVEIPREEYADFTDKWITEAERILRPGGSMYIVSGYTNLIHILNALNKTRLIERNHIIWKYNFGVYTTKKYVSSHYHILYYTKGSKNITFNTDCRHTLEERTEKGGSVRYSDMEDVWVINREYKPGVVKNKNQLPEALLTKIIEYSSKENDTVVDFFAGSFSTVFTAHKLGRKGVGFEINKNAYSYAVERSMRSALEKEHVSKGKRESAYA